MKQSLGLLEAKGLLGAITATDAMVKSADIHILGIEKTKGFGWMTVTICGDVGAVQAAIETGSALLKSMNLYIAEKVIPRPADGLEEVFCPQHSQQNEDNTNSKHKQNQSTPVMTNRVPAESLEKSEGTDRVETEQVEISQNTVQVKEDMEAKEIIAIIKTKGKSVNKKISSKPKKTK